MQLGHSDREYIYTVADLPYHGLPTYSTIQCTVYHYNCSYNLGLIFADSSSRVSR